MTDNDGPYFPDWMTPHQWRMRKMRAKNRVLRMASIGAAMSFILAAVGTSYASEIHPWLLRFDHNIRFGVIFGLIFGFLFLTQIAPGSYRYWKRWGRYSIDTEEHSS